MFRVKLLAVLLFVALISNSCGVYSFTGASLSPDIKTISVQTFYNNSGGGPPNMGQNFTEKVKGYFQQNTQLTVTRPQDGISDLKLEGTIVGYSLSPVAPTASTASNPIATSTLTRLTITVQTKFENTRDDSNNFDQSFSFYQDFPSNQSLQSVEAGLIDIILDQIVFDIFNKSVANW